MKIIVLLVSSLLLLISCSILQENEEVLTVVNPFPEYKIQFEIYADEFEKDTGIQVEIFVPEEGQTPNELIEEMILANNPPDIFPIAGYVDYLMYQDIIYAFQNEKWIDDTIVEFEQNGIVYGFPIALEGTGIIVNTEYTEAVGIDYKEVDTYDEFLSMLFLLEHNKAFLGYDALFGVTLDKSADDIEILLNMLFNGNKAEEVAAYFSGSTDALDFENYSELINTIFLHSASNAIYLTDDEIEQNFAHGDYVFMIGSSTVSQELYEYGMDMQKIDLMPAPYNELSSDRISISIPYYWSINKYGDVEEALLFLNNLVFTPYGQNLLSTDTPFLSPFEEMAYVPYQINETVLEYYHSRHYSIGYANEIGNEYLAEIYAPIYIDFYIYRDYDAFITDIKNASAYVTEDIERKK